MASGYRRNGVDFDDIFDFYAQGATSRQTGRRLNGADLSQRYAHISFGGKAADVGHRVDGVDLSNLWAAKGTASYVIAGLHGKELSAHDGAATNQPQVYATVQVYLVSDGAWVVSGSTARGPVGQDAPTSGRWLPDGASVSDYEVMFQVSASGNSGHSVQNSAPGYASLTTGRSASLTLGAISAVNTTWRDAYFEVLIHLRRISTGSVSLTKVTGSISTNGWV